MAPLLIDGNFATPHRKTTDNGRPTNEQLSHNTTVHKNDNT